VLENFIDIHFFHILSTDAEDKGGSLSKCVGSNSVSHLVLCRAGLRTFVRIDKSAEGGVEGSLATAAHLVAKLRLVGVGDLGIKGLVVGKAAALAEGVLHLGWGAVHNGIEGLRSHQLK